MDLDEFWSVVEAARADAAGDDEADPDDGGFALGAALTARLCTLPPAAVVEFERRFRALHAALYRWDVWGAGYLISGGCSDDGFEYFRAGLIGLGRAWYERAAADPDVLAEHPAVRRAAAAGVDEAVSAESLLYSAVTAYERLTGGRDAFYDLLTPTRAEHGAPQMGEPWDFDDAAQMHRRLPRLARLFLGGGSGGG